MERWGASLYGNPCRGCGFDWSLTPREAIRVVEELPTRFRALLAGHTGYERHPDLSWTPAAYVSHVTDNLRNWAERLAGARLSGAVTVPGYDPDLVGQARHYNEIAPAAALWSLEHAAGAWAASVTSALEEGIVLEHATRGVQRAEDVARNNAHDGYHHAWDIERILHQGSLSRRCPHLLALPGEDGGNELRVGMASPPQVTYNGIDVEGHTAVGDGQGIAIVFKQEPAGDAAGTGHAGAAGIEGADAVNETIGDGMSVAADDHIGTAAGKQRLEPLLGDAGLDPGAVVGPG